METTLKDRLDEAGIDTSSLTVSRITFWECPAGRISTLAVPGAEAIAAWRTLRALVPQTGHWPVLIGDALDLEYYQEGAEGVNPKTISEALQQARDLSATALLRRWQDEREAGGDPELPEDTRPGDWPEGDHSVHGFSIPIDYKADAPKPEIVIALVPTSLSWEVPALLYFGGWNSCPLPEEHVCLMKHWHEAYGAEVVGITHDVVEMQVARPPVTPEAAMALAREQCVYCEDIVEQGVGMVENLAATLLNGTVWFFWWD